jgi:DNA polymerase-3 subunit alpha
LDIIKSTPEHENEELKNLYESDDKVKNAIEYGDALTGNMRQLGVHACGIIIAPEQVIQYTPTQYNKENDHTIVSQYDGPTLEYIGLLKMDFLGLRNLSIIKNCIKIIKARSEKEGTSLPEMFQHFLDTMSFDPPLDDAYTYEKVFKEGDTTGIFQFESAGMRRFLIQLEPTKIDNIVAMAALYRPGPMEFIPSYIERRHGREEIEYLYTDLREELTKKYGVEVAEEERRKLIEDLDPIMKDTYGIAVYQEQLMFLVQSMAGFSLGEADLLRRGIGKKKREIIEEMKKKFIERGAEFRNYKPETTTQIYEKMIEPAAQYSFNKSHAVCYAVIAYQTAYLKAYHPLEFYAALIRSVEEDTDTQSFYISEIQQHGIVVLAPDVNESFNHVAAINDVVRI